ncbi:MAG: hypothetical protein ROO76_21670 [Terriglobia bacterium]|jgi:hypothetical protein|nr:hypothetical protein [Terriglobia bacterium]
MILLITSSKRAPEYVVTLEHEVGEEAEIADTTKRALAQLRNGEYSTVVIDEAFVESEPEAIEMLLRHAGMAVPVYVNLAISGPQRVVREVKLTLRRQEESRLIAIRAAESLLRTELRGAVTGILLSTELALRTPDLPGEAADKMRSVCQLAAEIRSRLETVQ